MGSIIIHLKSLVLLQLLIVSWDHINKNEDNKEQTATWDTISDKTLSKE